MSAPRSASDSQSKLAGSADGSALLPTLADTMEFCPLVPPTGCHPVDRRPTIQDIFRLYGQAYMEKYADRMSLDQIRVMDAITHCRSEEAGYIEFDCLACDHKHRVPKACGNRHCPGCQGNSARKWLQNQSERLLPCAYFMVTFTVPEVARKFIRSHPKKCYKSLFLAAHQALTQVAANPRHLGSGRMGMTGVLHTWGRDLNYHPHLHFVVPGGALSEDGQQWLSSRVDFLVPVEAVSKLFRAKFRDRMREEGLLDQFPPSLWREGWNVNIQPAGDGRLVLKYLAPYVFRVAIGNHRIVKVQPAADGSGLVTFLVKPSKQKHYRPMTVTAEEFIRRFLQHVLPRGFQKVRHFGFMHKRSKVSCQWLQMLVTVTLNLVYVLEVGLKAPPEKRRLLCEKCGQPMKCSGLAGGEALRELRQLFYEQLQELRQLVVPINSS